MAVAFVAGGSGGNSSASTLDTSTFTVDSASNKVLVTIVRWLTGSAATVSSVVWDPTGVNEAFTSAQAATSSGNQRWQAFYRINPTAATAKAVRVTFSDASNGSAGIAAAEFSGADQTTPVPTADIVTATGTSSSTISVTVTNMASGDMAMDGSQDNWIGGDTIGANQTQIGTENTPGDIYNSSYQATTDGVMTWTLSSTANWFTGGVRIAQASAGGAAEKNFLTLLGAGA